MENESKPCFSTHPITQRVQWATIFFLFVISVSGYLWFPHIGYRRWDGLMTASVLHFWQLVPNSLIFFFAHPLVIPITKLFDLFTPFKDPYFVVVFREAFFTGLNVGLLFWVLSKVFNRWSSALLASLTFAATFGHRWMVGCGEEKGVALLAANLFLILYLMRQGEITPCRLFGYAWFEKLRDYILGGLLGLALIIHLSNVLLIPYVIVSVLTYGDNYRKPLRASRKTLPMLLVAAAISITFYAIIVFKVNNIKSLAGAITFFTEYHTSGSFLGVKSGFFNQLVLAYIGLRNFLLSPFPFGLKSSYIPVLECVLALLSLPLVFRAAYRQRPALTRHLGIYLVVLGAHYFFWEPWNPETWANVAFPGFFVLALALHNFEIKVRGNYIWGALLITLLFGNYCIRQMRLKKFGPLLELSPAPANFGCLEKRLWAHTPFRQVAVKASSIMPDDAIVLIKSRFQATYFQLYRPQRPIVLRYLDHSPEYLKKVRHLTNLSIYFYTPHLSSRQIFKRMRKGQPTYLLTNKQKNLKKVISLLNPKHIKRYQIGNTDYWLYKFMS